MKTVNIYLNFEGTTEAAFNFYKSVFGGEFMGGIMRYKDFPPSEDMPPLSEAEKNLVGHVSLPLGKQILMGTDIVESLCNGHKTVMGNNVLLTLETDSIEETETLFGKLSEGGQPLMPPAETFWAEKFGSCTDKFGVHWQLNYTGSKAPEQM
ncbi:VOC family protein [Sinomicrobium weinanense]|uniref:VOC family protein n=1 Tax=Sinomicrobium weinanense TaxID=2842200 RepID=A0A926JUK7_9FLAO|nr:VOC family protein [Sinomicrobium weinanense]MBC9797833.1 VOC family protein [Sinomicrobium weinanense]MBU3124668.1 VOC family protein [Sinomicrobium weinanense]